MLVNCSVKHFEQMTKLDPSGTDAIHAVYSVEVEGYVSDSTAASMGALIGRANPPIAAQAINQIKQAVWQPRQTLRLLVADTPILEAYPSQQTGVPNNVVDVDNGPVCVAFNIKEIFGRRAMRVTIRLKCCLLECGADMKPLNQIGIVNNRWSIEESIGTDWHVQQVISGHARVAHMDVWDNAYKWFVLPPVLPGFRVERMDFARSANGLDITYRIELLQKYSAPPFPAIDWNCTAKEMTDIAGAIGKFVFTISLLGGPEATKRQLFIAAIDTFTARGRHKPADPTVSSPAFLVRQVAVTDFLHENRLDMSIEMDRFTVPEGGDTTKAVRSWLTIVWETLGILPPIEFGQQPRRDSGAFTDVWPVPEPNSHDFVVSMFAMHWQSPCVGGVSFAHRSEQPIVVSSPEQEEEEPQQSSSQYPGDPSIPEYPGSKADQDPVMPWLYVELESRYIVDHGRIAFPFVDAWTFDSDEKACVIRRVHKPLSKRCIWFRAERFGGKPTSPPLVDTFTDANGIEYFLDESEILPSPAKLTPDGTQYTYVLEMRLVYLMDRPLKTTEAMISGALPWDTSTLAENSVTMSEIGDNALVWTDIQSPGEGKGQI